MGSGQEQRREPRAPIALRVEYKRLNSFFDDYAKNISRGGTFIRTERPLPIGTDFLFQLGIPGMDEPLTLRGRVQWIVTPEQSGDEQEPGMGIGFNFESEAERERVDATVETLMVDSLGRELFEQLVGKRRHEE